MECKRKYKNNTTKEIIKKLNNMKKLNSLKLSEMAAENLSDREMKEIKGGRSCGCSCYWAGSGGSSTDDNCVANYYQGSGASSTSGSTQMICHYP